MSGNEPVMSQRARFEAWAEDYGLDISPYSDDNEYYEAGDTGAAWEAWQAACPDGWQCVPKEPAGEMLDRA